MKASNETPPFEWRDHVHHYDRDHLQLPIAEISAERIVRSGAFAAGVKDRRSGNPPRYDDFNFDQSDSEAIAAAKINGHWNYERGRQWATIAPLSLQLKIDGKLNPKVVVLYEAACKRGFTL